MIDRADRCWIMCFVGTMLLVAPQHLDAQRSIGINKVKSTETSAPFCETEPAYKVSLRDGPDPIVEYKVWLKAEPDSNDEEVILRVELIDVDGKVVEMVDSAREVTQRNPPWITGQSVQVRQYILPLENRRPKRFHGSRYRIRVSVDSIKTSAKESQVFQLYWTPFCKPLTDSAEVR